MFGKNLTPEQRKQRIENIVKVLLLCVVAFAVSPIITAVIQGLIGLLIALSIGYAAVFFTPYFAMKFANWRLKAIKHEASQNPIETLENQYKERQEALATFRENILTFHAEVQNFYSELEKHREMYPQGVAKFEEQYNKMRALLESRGKKYKLVQKKLADFGDVIEQKRSEWNIAQAAAKMTKAAGVGEDFMSKLMEDTALGSVQTSLNTAFAELEVSLLDEQPLTSSNVTVEVAPAKPMTAIPEKSGPPTLDLGFDVAEPVPVKKRTKK